MSSTGAYNPSSVNSVSTEAFTTSLVTNLIIFSVEIGLFILVFRIFPQVYEPRTFMPRTKEKRTDPLPRSPLGWVFEIYHAPATLILEKNGLDAYMFYVYLQMMTKIFLPQWVVTWILMLPVYGTGRGGKTGLYILTFGNVATTKQTRYALPLILVYFFTFYIYYVLWGQMKNFIKLRHDFLTSPDHVRLPQSKTVLVTGIPPEFRQSQALMKLAEYLPGAAERVWMVRDIGTSLPQLYKRQTSACSKLEAAETTLIKRAVKARHKAEQDLEKLAKKQAKSKSPLDPNLLEEKRLEIMPQFDPEQPGSIADQLVQEKDRPKHTINAKAFIPFTGQKTDTINWCKQEIVTVVEQLKEERSHLAERPPSSSAFIRFRTQIAAHMFQQTTVHHLPLRMGGRYIEVASDDVIYGNLNINPFQQRIRFVISWGITIGLLVAWSFPVAFVALLSNVNQLCVKYSWIRWLCRLPVPINGIIQGVLPPVALAILFLVLPIILRLLATFEGIPLKSLVELSLMKRYFLFLFIHGFIVCTLASGLIASLPQIANNPASTVTILAKNLPDASNFFLTYVITQGISGAASSFIQIVQLILYYVFLFLLASTPRKVHNLSATMQSTQWGTLFPNITLLTVIALGYSIIAPIVNGFAVVAFVLFAFAYKYLFIWVYDQPIAGETGGLFFPLAIHHTFCGLYIEMLCLTGLFFLARNSDNRASAIPEGAFMIVLIILTILFHLYAIPFSFVIHYFEQVLRADFFSQAFSQS